MNPLNFFCHSWRKTVASPRIKRKRNWDQRNRFSPLQFKTTIPSIFGHDGSVSQLRSSNTLNSTYLCCGPGLAHLILLVNWSSSSWQVESGVFVQDYKTNVCCWGNWRTGDGKHWCIEYTTVTSVSVSPLKWDRDIAERPPGWGMWNSCPAAARQAHCVAHSHRAANKALSTAKALYPL